MLTVNWDTASVFGKCDPDQVRTGSRSSSPGLISRRAPGFSFCSLQGVLTSVFTLSHPTQCSRLGITAVYFQDSLCQNLASDTSGKKKLSLWRTFSLSLCHTYHHQLPAAVRHGLVCSPEERCSLPGRPLRRRFTARWKKLRHHFPIVAQALCLREANLKSFCNLGN